MFGKAKKLGAVAMLGVAAGIAAGCGGSGPDDSGSGGSSGDGVQVAATTSVIRDMVEQVGGDRVEVTSIVPLGGSPETFQPTPRDAGRISDSVVVFQNGLGLDDWVDDLIESAGNEDQLVVEVSEGLEPIEGDHSHGDEEHAEEGHSEEEHSEEDHAHEEGTHSDEEHADEEHSEEGHAHDHSGGDPHFWLDVENGEHYVEGIRDSLIEADPAGEEEYRRNAEDYLATLGELDGYIEEQAQNIPEENRKLVTTHEAFAYFAEAYDFELEGSIIRNPEAEPSSREVAEVVETIEAENVPAIFTEPQFSSGIADTISGEAGVEVYELYSDTLVEEDSGNTYEAMMRTNIDRLVEGLGS